MQELIDELVRFRDWLLEARPIRILVASAGGSVLSEQRQLEARLRTFSGLSVLGEDEDLPGRTGMEADVAEVGDRLRREVPRSDIVVLLVPHADNQPESVVLEHLADDMTPIALASRFRKRGLAWGIVSPLTEDDERIADQAGAQTTRTPAASDARSPKSSLGGVLRDRDVRILRAAWRGDLRSAAAVEREVVAEVQRAAIHVRLMARVLRLLVTAASLLVAAWLLIRFGFFGLLLVLALAGGAYLRILDRRWSRSA